MPEIKAGTPVRVSLILDGETREGLAPTRMLLSDFLRHELGATGTHVGCEHGVCGACTVRLDGRAVRSCLMLAVQADGRRIDTVEGSDSANPRLAILREEFRRHHALQCGFCTPGILMSLADFLERCPRPTETSLREMLSGHLCRCTGYTGIARAGLAAAERLAASEKSNTDV